MPFMGTVDLFSGLRTLNRSGPGAATPKPVVKIVSRCKPVVSSEGKPFGVSVKTVDRRVVKTRCESVAKPPTKVKEHLISQRGAYL